MQKTTLGPKVRDLLLLVVLGLASVLVACSDNSPRSSTNDNSTEGIDPNTDAGPNEQTASGLISTTTLQNSGFRGVIPLLEVQASVTISEEFGYITEHALSPDGNGLAIVIAENRLFNPPPVPKGDRIEIYSTETGKLVQTIQHPELFEIFGHLFWSNSNQIHWFYGSFAEEGENWLSWDVSTGAIVQNQLIIPSEPCDNWSGMFFNAFQSNSDTVIFLEKNDDNTQSHLCRINLSDSTTSTAVINYPVIGSPLISSDGSITAVMQANSPDSTFFIERTHTYDTSSLFYRNEVYENEGFPRLFGSGFRLNQSGSSYLYILPSNERLDIDISEVKVSESGKLLSAKNPVSRDYVRFVTLPEGIVIGDSKESDSQGAHTRRISRDGDVAIIATRQSDLNNYRFDVYNLSKRTNYTALEP